MAAGQAASGPPAGAPSGANAFNPAISLVLQGNAVSYSRDPDAWRLPGFQTGGEAGLRNEGLSLDETELTVSASVDDWFYGQATVGIHQDGDETEVGVEEAYLDTLGLPGGAGLRAGRFYSDIGYLNSRHTHTWDFADAPLAYQAFLGGQYADDGVRLTWLAPTDTFLELGVEALRGDRFPGGGDAEHILGDTHTAFARLGGDLGDSSWRLGLSHLRASPDARGGGHGHGHGDEDHEVLFDGDSRLTIADLVWKWAPGGDPTRRNLTLQSELFHRKEDGVVRVIEDGLASRVLYDGEQEGVYVQGVYQFMPRWRFGLRYDRLWTDNELRVPRSHGWVASALLDGATAGDLGAEWLGMRRERPALLRETGLLDGEDPQRWSAMVDYTHSEFSRLRLQYARDDSGPHTDHQWMLQYIMTLGAHGAHRF
jgi:hypothetical protein